MGGIQIHKTSEIKAKSPVVVLGFPGTGLVGSIAATQLVESLGLDFCGYITSPDFAPLAAIHDYMPFPAARIHYSPKHNLVVILSEMSIPVGSSQDLADMLYKFARSLNATSIISLGGISLKESRGAIYVISSDKAQKDDLVKRKLARPIKEGATTGVTGVLLTKGMLENYPVVTLLAESSEEYLDPRAASRALQVLSKMLNIKIDTAQLDKEAKEMTTTLKEGMIKGGIPKKKGGPSAGEGGGMYG